MKSKITTLILMSIFFFSAIAFAHRTPPTHKKNTKSEYKCSPILDNKPDSHQSPKNLSMSKYLTFRESKSSLKKYLKSHN